MHLLNYRKISKLLNFKLNLQTKYYFMLNICKTTKNNISYIPVCKHSHVNHIGLFVYAGKYEDVLFYCGNISTCNTCFTTLHVYSHI